MNRVTVIFGISYGYDTRMGHDSARSEVLAVAKDLKSAKAWVKDNSPNVDRVVFRRMEVVA